MTLTQTANAPRARLSWRPPQSIARPAAFLRRPLIADGLLAALVLLALGPGVTTDAEINPEIGTLWRTLAEVAMVAPIVCRRRAPVWAFATFASVAFGQLLLGAPLGTEAAGLIILYTLADRERTRTIAGATALTVACASAAAIGWNDGSADDLVPRIGWVLALTTVAVALGLLRRTQRAYVTERAARVVANEAARARELEAARATERAHLARETHDVTAHGLAVMISLADGAAVAAERDPETAKELMDEIAATGRRSLADLRGVLGAIEHGPADRRPQPGLDDIAELLDPVRRAGLEVSLQRAGSPRSLSAVTQLTAYRVVQEALTNVLKHATDVQRVQVLLEWAGHDLVVAIRDDGAAHDGAPTAGRGLSGLRERTGSRGATLVAGPMPGGGWSVETKLPAEYGP